MNDRRKPQTDELDGLVSRLPKEIAPPLEVWRKVAAEIERPSLDSLAAELPAEIEPPADLWPRIEAELGKRRDFRGLLAAAVVVAAISAALIAIAVRNDVGELARPPTESPVADREAEPRDLVDRWLDDFSPAQFAVAQTIEMNLALLRDERIAIEHAIEQYPSDPNLRELWAHAYEAELRLENEIGSVMVSTERG
jgi:hypothetical protein